MADPAQIHQVLMNLCTNVAHAMRKKEGVLSITLRDVDTVPHMTGIVLAKEVLKIRPDTPIILCTGFSEALDENSAKLLGIKEFLMKPVALRDLASTVKKVLFQDKPIT